MGHLVHALCFIHVSLNKIKGHHKLNFCIIYYSLVVLFLNVVLKVTPEVQFPPKYIFFNRGSNIFNYSKTIYFFSGF